MRRWWKGVGVAVVTLAATAVAGGGKQGEQYGGKQQSEQATERGVGGTAGQKGVELTEVSEGEFLTMLVQAHQLNVDAAQLAQDKAQSNELKELAFLIGEEHRKASQDIRQYAREHDLDLSQFKQQGTGGLSGKGPSAQSGTGGSGEGKAELMRDPGGTPAGQERIRPGLNPYGKNVLGQLRQHYSRLQSASGSAFDDRFLGFVARSHELLITQFEAGKERFARMPSADLLDSQLKMVRGHLDRANRLLRGAGVGGAGQGGQKDPDTPEHQRRAVDDQKTGGVEER